MLGLVPSPGSSNTHKAPAIGSLFQAHILTRHDQAELGASQQRAVAACNGTGRQGKDSEQQVWGARAESKGSRGKGWGQGLRAGGLKASGSEQGADSMQGPALTANLQHRGACAGQHNAFQLEGHNQTSNKGLIKRCPSHNRSCRAVN